ncbi:MAG: TetR/AcrR family transcriptional regulator, partial [Coprobacillus cateniformis]
LEKLESILNMIYTYLYENENLALISILTDHKTPTANDNTNQTLNVWKPLIIDICSKNNISNPNLISMLLIQSLQGVFLRTNLIKQELDIDLRNPIERKDFIHKTLEYYFGEIL